MRNPRSMGFVAVLVVAMVMSAPVYANLVVNGSFENTTHGPDLQLGFNTDEIGWTVPDPHMGLSYFFVYAPGDADLSGALGEYGIVKIWGPQDGSPNGLPPTSPDGGNFIGADGAFQQGTISQTINGLTSGSTYQVSFWWAAAQESGDLGTTSSQWLVTFGSQHQATAQVQIPSEGFSGWMKETMTFTADGTSDVLSFFASGGPAGLPPFALLDGVDVEPKAPPVQEPESLALMATGIAGLIGYSGIHRRKTRR